MINVCGLVCKLLLIRLAYLTFIYTTERHLCQPIVNREYSKLNIQSIIADSDNFSLVYIVESNNLYTVLLDTTRLLNQTGQLIVPSKWQSKWYNWQGFQKLPTEFIGFREQLRRLHLFRVGHKQRIFYLQFSNRTQQYLIFQPTVNSWNYNKPNMTILHIKNTEENSFILNHNLQGYFFFFVRQTYNKSRIAFHEIGSSNKSLDSIKTLLNSKYTDLESIIYIQKNDIENNEIVNYHYHTSWAPSGSMDLIEHRLPFGFIYKDVAYLFDSNLGMVYLLKYDPPALKTKNTFQSKMLSRMSFDHFFDCTSFVKNQPQTSATNKGFLHFIFSEDFRLAMVSLVSVLIGVVLLLVIKICIEYKAAFDHQIMIQRRKPMNKTPTLIGHCCMLFRNCCRRICSRCRYRKMPAMSGFVTNRYGQKVRRQSPTTSSPSSRRRKRRPRKSPINTETAELDPRYKTLLHFPTTTTNNATTTTTNTTTDLSGPNNQVVVIDFLDQQ